MPPMMPDEARWRALAQRAAEPAILPQPAFLRAALQHLPPARRPHVHVVEDADANLLLLAPLQRERWRWPPLGRVASSRWGDFFLLGTPLLAADDPERAVHDLLRATRRASLAALELRTIAADGAFLAALRAVLARHGLQPLELARWQRAALDAGRDPEDWWRQDVGRKRRKEWTRLKRKLGEQGEVRFEHLPADAGMATLADWMEDFLRLEAAGWKGRAGTALLCDAHNAGFVRAMTAGFHATGDLRFWRLRLNGDTIAALFGMRAGDTLWLGKIAYDESMRRFSPGVLLTIEATRAILADPLIRFADSGADPDHPMIDHLWRQRLELVDVLAPLPGVADWRFHALARLETGYRRLRRQAGELYRRLRQRRLKRH